MKKPLILVTNDDGINAPGIRLLVKIMNNIGDVVVVAPDGPRSGMSSAITIESTIRCNKIVIDNGPQEEYSCSGTTVDCVKLATNVILKRKPDLCVSGINHGSNSSINVIYSGTMAGSIEGALEGIPSIGFSILDSSLNADMTEIIQYVESITLKVLKHSIDKGLCLNVNFPKKKKDIKVKGVKVCRQANANWIEEFDERIDPNGKKYYWLTGKFVNYDSGKDTDEWALANHYVSIVPVQFDLTNYNSLIDLKKIF